MPTFGHTEALEHYVHLGEIFDPKIIKNFFIRTPFVSTVTVDP